MRKILNATIKTIDEKNHVKIWTLKDIEKIVFKGDKETKDTSMKEEKKEPPKETKKDSDKKKSSEK